jgi:hypothetical protein
MAFVAGYVSAGAPYDNAALLERLRAFAILPSEPNGASENRVLPVDRGHVVVKYKPTYPRPPRIATDAAGNVLVTLGFMVDDSRDVLASCATTGGRALEECEGEFLAVFADAARGELHLVNDRFAARPCYVLRRPNGFYFSSNLAWLYALARERYRPDPVGWLEVFSYAHTNGTRTTSQGIQRLQPATHVSVTPERLAERRYWRLQHDPDPGLDPATHSSRVFEAFRAGAERRAGLVSGGVLALSGGLDSRLMAAALPKGLDFSAFTFVDAPGVRETAQTRAAAQVCAALGLRHDVERLPSRLAAPADVVALTGGMRPYHHMAIAMAYVNEIRRQEKRFLLGGGPGDVLAGSYIPTAAYLDPAHTAECIRDACRRRLARSRNWPLVFRDDVIASAGSTVADRLAESFESVGGPTAAHRLTGWGMVYRQPAFTFTSVFHTHPEVMEAVCHLDYKYSDLMLRLPATWLYKRAFYAFMIHRELPQLRHVPYANTGAPLTGQPPTLEVPGESMRARAARLLVAIGAPLARRIVRRVIPRRARAARWLVLGDAALLAEVEEVLHSTASLGDVLDIRRCDEFIRNVRAGVYHGGGHEEVLGGLTAMCMAEAVLRQGRAD